LPGQGWRLKGCEAGERRKRIVGAGLALALVCVDLGQVDLRELGQPADDLLRVQCRRSAIALAQLARSVGDETTAGWRLPSAATRSGCSSAWTPAQRRAAWLLGYRSDDPSRCANVPGV
jgi:hypothetical protein